VTRFVVDASVAVKWLVPEVHSGAARALLRAGSVLLAPDLIRAEVGNVLWKRWRRGELDAAEVDAALADFRGFPLEVHSAEPLLESAWAIARATGLTVYDSLYAALAVAQPAPLVTADRCLFEALRGGALAAACVWVENAAGAGGAGLAGERDEQP
jgi:predicted nucleic acid-binding protein